VSTKALTLIWRVEGRSRVCRVLTKALTPFGTVEGHVRGCGVLMKVLVLLWIV
jgi:hypothetical protein